jgi:D-threo-aldose 1-dehydrogenase
MRAGRTLPLGRTALRVTRLGLGTAPLGGPYEDVDEEAAQDTVRAAYDAGVRLFDTAPLYGFGLAERRTGAALRALPRDEIVLSTKVGRLLQPELHAELDFGYDATLRSLEGSLTRIGLDRVDVALVHDPDDHYEQARDGAYRALERLRAEGVVKAIGVGMNQTGLLLRFAQECDVDCLLVEGRWTLLDGSAGDTLLPLCAERGIAVLAGGVFNSGILAGRGTYDYRAVPPSVGERARRLDEVCERWGVPLRAAALQFPFRHPAVASVVVGCRSPSEVEEDVALFKVDVPAGLWEELEK